MLDRTLISIVDDDEPFRESMRKLITLLGYTVEAFPSASDFLASRLMAETACLVSDVQMPGMTGVELHRHLVETGYAIPTILITAYPDDVVRDRALKDGVVATLASWWTTIISSGACVQHSSGDHRFSILSRGLQPKGRFAGPRAPLSSGGSHSAIFWR